MSHYAVAVIHKLGRDVDELLEPFDENLEVEKYLYKTKDQIIKDGWETRDNYIYNLKRDPALYCGWDMGDYITATCDDDIYALETKYDDPESYDEDGNRWSTYNTDAKYDWYIEGGRFSDMLKLKKEVMEREELEYQYVDSALLCDIDFSDDQESYQASLEFWDKYVDKNLDDGEEEPFTLYSEDYYKDFFGTKEYYAHRNAQFSTYAVVTPDGKWHEPGKIGWFAITDSTPQSEREYYDNYYTNFIEKYIDDPDMAITIIDCHI